MTDAPGPLELAAECAPPSLRGQGRGQGPGPAWRGGAGGCARARRSPGPAWDDDRQRPAPGGPWAWRACRGRGLRSRPRHPAQPPPAHPKNRAGGYAGRGRGVGRSHVALGGFQWRAGLGRELEARWQARPRATLREAGVAGPRIAGAESAQSSPCGIPGPGGAGT